MQEPRCARPCINVACQVPGTAFCDLYLYLYVAPQPHWQMYRSSFLSSFHIRGGLLLLNM
jgi:hypothetical protein